MKRSGCLESSYYCLEREFKIHVVSKTYQGFFASSKECLTLKETLLLGLPSKSNDKKREKQKRDKMFDVQQHRVQVSFRISKSTYS